MRVAALKYDLCNEYPQLWNVCAQFWLHLICFLLTESTCASIALLACHANYHEASCKQGSKAITAHVENGLC